MKLLLRPILVYLMFTALLTCLVMITEWLDPILVTYKYNGSMFIFFCEFALPKSAAVAIPAFWACVLGEAILSNENVAKKKED